MRHQLYFYILDLSFHIHLHRIFLLHPIRLPPSLLKRVSYSRVSNISAIWRPGLILASRALSERGGHGASSRPPFPGTSLCFDRGRVGFNLRRTFCHLVQKVNLLLAIVVFEIFRRDLVHETAE